MSAKNSGKECPGNLNRACNDRNCPGKRINLKKFEFLTAHFRVMRVGSDTFGDPIFQKGL